MATAKQLAARKRFAAMARSGELQKARNPAKKRPAKRAKKPINAPSQATGKKPSPRLKARRAANTKPGVYPNPSTRMRKCSVVDATSGRVIATGMTRRDANEYAKALANKNGKPYGVK